MSEFDKEVEDIEKSTAPINPNVHNLKNTMCFKTWHDLIISLPNRSVKWCCKTQMPQKYDDELKFDLETLEEQGLDFFINHPILKQRKYDLSGGTRSPDCIGCWKTEEVSVSGESVRTEYNRTFNPLWKRRLEMATNHPKKAIQFHQEVQKYDGFKFIEIELTNKCNMACAYCWEGLSSRWQKEVGRYHPDTDDLIFDKVIELLKEYWHSTLKDHPRVNFSLLGGEPFFSNHMFKFIEEYIVEINDSMAPEKDIEVTVTTNLNFPKEKFDRFLKLVERTPNIIYNMQLSGEAIGKRSEYVRWGLKWDNWVTNIDAFFKSAKQFNNLVLGFGCAHNSLTFIYFKEWLEFIESKVAEHEYRKPIYMHHNWVDNPYPLSVAMIDPKHVDKVDEIIDYFTNMKAKIFPKQRYLGLLNTLRSHVASEVSEEDKIAAYKFFEPQQLRRKISYSDIFPHFSELVKTDK